VFVTYSLPNYNKHEKFDKMLPKAVTLLSAAIISKRDNTSIAESLDANSQLITRG